jgi:hypothetical protein
MVDGISEIAILVTAILAVAVGSVWYSPLCFGEAWMRAAGLKPDDLALPKERLLFLIVAGISANVSLLTVLGWFIVKAQSIQLSEFSVAGFLVVFIVSLMVSIVLWEKRPITYILIHTGYASIVIFGGITVLAYWPW